MASKGRNIIVIGTSAGGLEALDTLIGQLPTNLPASIFIVQHLAPENDGGPLLHRLGRHRAFGCKLAKDGESFRLGRIYIAPPDNHLLVKKDRILVTKGARENRSRPGIDPLFRSAAVTHTSSVIGVLLTGMLDDGTAGLMAIKKCGGVTVVQDPKDAAYPGMPQSALNSLTRSITVCRSVKWGVYSKHLPENVQAKASRSQKTSGVREYSCFIDYTACNRLRLHHRLLSDIAVLGSHRAAPRAHQWRARGADGALHPPVHTNRHPISSTSSGSCSKISTKPRRFGVDPE
jgi:hypothetical protein